MSTRIVITVGTHPDEEAFVDELLGECWNTFDSTDIEGIPVTWSIEAVAS